MSLQAAGWFAARGISCLSQILFPRIQSSINWCRPTRPRKRSKAMQYKNKGPPKRSSIVRQTGSCKVLYLYQISIYFYYRIYWSKWKFSFSFKLTTVVSSHNNLNYSFHLSNFLAKNFLNITIWIWINTSTSKTNRFRTCCIMCAYCAIFFLYGIRIIFWRHIPMLLYISVRYHKFWCGLYSF